MKMMLLPMQIKAKFDFGYKIFNFSEIHSIIRSQVIIASILLVEE